MSETPVILCVIHHRQNPIESGLIKLEYIVELTICYRNKGMYDGTL
jgi:hypothetical protein